MPRQSCTTSTTTTTTPSRPKRSTRNVLLMSGHPTCVFLLPFLDNPSTHMEGLIKRQSKTQIQSYTALDQSTDHSQLPSFSSCILTRGTDEQLVDGDADAMAQISYVFEPGQFILLRTVENNVRPGVARIESFHTCNGRNVIRVCWFYRGEDIAEPIQGGIPSEDEVFESCHFDLVDADSIAGRCKVTSYADWLKAKSEEREQGQEENNDNKSKTNNDVDDNDDNNDTVDMVYLNEFEDDDDSSEFRDNYCEASLHLFCRKFYDTHTNSFVTSRFERSDANPLEELNSIRAASTAAITDPDYDGQLGTVPSDSESDSSLPPSPPLSDHDDVENENEDDDEFKPKKQRTKRPLKRRRRATGGLGMSAGAVSFALPTELGVTEKLPCRDEQKEHVRRFMLGVIHDADGINAEISRCLYISGVPGTGKTATVREVVRDLRTQRQKGEVPPFRVLELNAMTMHDPCAVYVHLYNTVTGIKKKSLSGSHAAHLLEQRYMRGDLDGNQEDFKQEGGKKGGKGSRERSRGRGKNMGSSEYGDDDDENMQDDNNSNHNRSKHDEGVTIVVLDELDVLLARRQKVVYDMLEWPTRRNARLAVIGIANTMDLPERMLPRMGSRLGLNRLVYPPYTRDQLMQILRLTLSLPSGITLNEEALRLCASKVGGVSGDVRRALELCRRATELCCTSSLSSSPSKDTKSKAITISHMQRAIQEAAGDYRVVALQQLSVVERLALVAAIAVSRATGGSGFHWNGGGEMENSSGNSTITVCSIDTVCDKAWHIATRFDSVFSAVKPQPADVEEACWRLAASRFIVIERATVKRNSRVIVNIPVDDVSFALKDCPMCMAVVSDN